MAMEMIYASLAGALAILGGLIFAFFKGRSSGKTEVKLDQVIKAEEVKATIQESDNAVNSQDRASLIESLSADSVRSRP
jgi:hypothetical protein